MPVRVAAISFLNPAPLLYDFEHESAASRLRAQYSLHYTSPAQCAAQMHSGETELGLIPIAELTPDLVIVPGCTIASLREVRSILLLVRNPGGLSETDALRSVRTLAADAASRSSQAYVGLILERFYGVRPVLSEQTADPMAMLAEADAALLIGDPALLAREHRATIEAKSKDPLLWLDLARLWREHTGLPWVAAVWAARADSLPGAGVEPAQLIDDLNSSRDNGLAHVEDLVHEWTPRLAVSPETIRAYLSHNIHYQLDNDCIEAIRVFRRLAAKTGILPALPDLRMLG